MGVVNNPWTTYDLRYHLWVCLGYQRRRCSFHVAMPLLIISRLTLPSFCSGVLPVRTRWKIKNLTPTGPSFTVREKGGNNPRSGTT